jgi:hypothetical protein
MTETTGRPGRIRVINNTGSYTDPDDLGLPKNITYIKDPNGRDTFWIPGRSIDPISSLPNIHDIAKNLKKVDGVEIEIYTDG